MFQLQKHIIDAFEAVEPGFECQACVKRGLLCKGLVLFANPHSVLPKRMESIRPETLLCCRFFQAFEAGDFLHHLAGCQHCNTCGP